MLQWAKAEQIRVDQTLPLQTSVGTVLQSWTSKSESVCIANDVNHGDIYQMERTSQGGKKTLKAWAFLHSFFCPQQLP